MVKTYDEYVFSPDVFLELYPLSAACLSGDLDDLPDEEALEGEGPLDPPP